MKNDQPWKGLRFVLLPWLFKKRVFEYSLKKTVVYIGEPMLSRAELVDRFETVPTDLEPYKRGLDPVTQLELRRFSIQPALPYGLNLDEATGAVDGIPSEPTEPTRYVVEALQKKKRYRAVFRIEVRPHTALPSSDEVDAEDYVEAPESAYTGAGLARDGGPVLNRRGEVLPPPRTKREKKRARKAGKRQRLQEEQDAKRQRIQQRIKAKRQLKKDKKEAKSQEKADKRQSKVDKKAAKKNRKGKGTASTSEADEVEDNAADGDQPDGSSGPERSADTHNLDSEIVIEDGEDVNDPIPDLQVDEEEPAEVQVEDEPEPARPKVKGTQAPLSIGDDEVEFDEVSGLPVAGNAWLGHPERGVRISWTGISGNTLTGVQGVKRKVPSGAVFRQGTLQAASTASTATKTANSPTASHSDGSGSSRQERKRIKKEAKAAMDAQETESSPAQANEPPSRSAASENTYPKGATSITLEDASSLPASGGAWIGGAERGVHITWSGKQGNTLTGVEGLHKSVLKSAQFVLDAADHDDDEVEEAPMRRPKF